MGIPALLDAAALITTGQCNVVLIAAGGAGVHSDRASTAPWTRPANELVVGYGLFTAAEFALMARRHMLTYGTTPEQMATAAAVIRTNGHANPEAVYSGRGPFSPEDILASRMVADPFHLLDCATTSEGGCAIVLVKADRAARLRGAGVDPRRGQRLVRAGLRRAHRSGTSSPAPTAPPAGLVGARAAKPRLRHGRPRRPPTSTSPSSTTRSRSRSSGSSRRSASARPARVGRSSRTGTSGRARRSRSRPTAGPCRSATPGSTRSSCSGSSGPRSSSGVRAPPTRSTARRSPSARTAAPAPSSATSSSWAGSAHEPPRSPSPEASLPAAEPPQPAVLGGVPAPRTALPALRRVLVPTVASARSPCARGATRATPVWEHERRDRARSTAGPWSGARLTPPSRCPYAPAVVRLDEGFWMLSAVIGCEPEALHEGLRLARRVPPGLRRDHAAVLPPGLRQPEAERRVRCRPPTRP